MKDIRYNGRLSFKIDDIGYVWVTRNEGFAVPYKSGKEKYSLVLLYEGCMRYEFLKTGEAVMLYPGDILFIPCHCPYIATYVRKSTSMKLFTFNVYGSIFQDLSDLPIKRTLPELSETISLSLTRDFQSTLFLAAKIYEILAAFESTALPIDKKHKKIMPAIEALRDRYYENHKMSYYANLCGIGESSLRRLFREYVGKSPIEYRNLIRISQVRRMLDSGEYTVSEAAYKAGFNNMSFFYQLYEK